MSLAPGQFLNNRYQIIALLGQGGMGSVYRAYDQTLSRNVALKERHPDPNATPAALAQARTQFQREAKVLANLTHPNLPRVTDYFPFGNNEYLVMDFVEGKSLDQVIQQQGALPEATVLAWADQLLAALEYIHARGIIHRDIKPQNILLTPDGHVMLADFGLVKLLDPNDPRTLTALRGMGTPEYAPLEQYATGVGHTDARSDLYSFGATLYHLLTGRAPVEVHQRLLNPATLPTPRAVNPRISEQVEQVVLKALEVYPQNRFQNAAEMRQALKPAPAQTPPMPTPPVVPPRVPTIAPVYAPPFQSAPTGMVFIPAGDFVMGSNDGDSNEEPVHTVYLDAFYIDRCPVTNAEYKKFVDATRHRAPKHWKNGRIPNGKEDHPVVNVSWDNASIYARWAGKRLPTEAEWEKAARGTDQRKYPWGNSLDGDLFSSSEAGRGDTTAVGSYPGGASPYGVLDMAGNVWEWVADWYGSYSSSSQRNPTGPSYGQHRVMRGGAWRSPGYRVVRDGPWGYTLNGIRAAIRGLDTPTNTNNGLGFRCARSP